MRGSTVRRLVGGLVGLLMAFGSLGGAAPDAAAKADLPVSALNDNWPRAVWAGQTVQFKVTLVNQNKSSKQVHFRFNVWCFNDAGPAGRWSYPTAWKPVRVPPSVRNAPGFAYVTETVVVPKKCSPPSYSLVRTNSHTGGGMMEVKPTAASTAVTSLPSIYYVYAAQDEANATYNLTARSQKPTPGTYQTHHTLPKAHTDAFERVGLNVHSPTYLRWWCSNASVNTNYAKNSAKYNQLWGQYFAKNPKPTKEAVLKYRSSIQGRFKYSC